MARLHFVYSSNFEEQLGYFCLLAIVNSAVVNIPV
jgi:hypothetical protein